MPSCATPECRRHPGVTGWCETCRPHPPLPDNLPPGAYRSLTYRKLDYWSRSGYLRPDKPRFGSGIDRVWPEEEVRVANLIARLTDAGLALAAAHRIAREAGDGAALVPLRGGIWLALDTQPPAGGENVPEPKEEPRATAPAAAHRAAPTRPGRARRPHTRDPQPEGA